MIHTDSINPAFRYEGLARAAFKCTKFGDPFGYACQDHYGSHFVEEITFEGRRALSTIFIKLIIDNSSSNHVDELKKLDNRVWEAQSQKEIINIIDKGIEILKKLGY